MDTEIRKDLLYGDMTYQIIGASMAVYNQLGVGLLVNFGNKEKLEWKRFVY